MSLSEPKLAETSPNPRRGTRITPRTCLWPLAGSLVATFGLSIGLTFRSNHHCFAGTCGEWLFPLQARLHVVVWYAWLSISVTFLAVRAFHPEMQKVLSRPLLLRKLPIVGKHLSGGGALMLCWVLTLYAVVVGIWWIRLRNYFVNRGIAGGVEHGGHQLAAVALTGHLCDITMGMVLLPISRHSALASFFKLSVSTTLTNHMLTAYTLFVLVLVHGLIYLSWVRVFNRLSTALRKIIPLLNPTYLYHETWPGNTSSLGLWRASLIFTGIVAVLIMSALFITTLPTIRSKHFNLFYFTHLFSILMVIIICLHASTMFYCTAPGLAMWFLDWGMRLYELRRLLDGEITTIGNGWYCINIPLPRSRLTGCSCRSPLAHFYIHHAGSSLRELHPFTTTTHLASQHAATPPKYPDLPIQFLFRKSRSPSALTPIPSYNFFRPLLHFLHLRKSPRKGTQWTEKLASLVDNDPIAQPPSLKGIPVSLRLEGPYFSPADPSRYAQTLCLVAGTGISGALAIATAFASQPSLSSSSHSIAPPPASQERIWRRCTILWSVKTSEAIDPPLPFFPPSGVEGLEIRVWRTGLGKERADLRGAVEDAKREGGGRMWAYISGPKAFVTAGEEACRSVGGVDFFAAGWG